MQGTGGVFARVGFFDVWYIGLGGRGRAVRSFYDAAPPTRSQTAMRR